MGEVWRAHDASLARDVALKLLPPAFADDPERLARFEREAKVLASLTPTSPRSSASTSTIACASSRWSSSPGRTSPRG